MGPRNLLLAGLFALLLAGASEGALASLPQPVIRDGPPLRQVGDGQLTWLGFRIYHASLWTQAGRFEGYAPGQPVALSLWYDRAFTREELARIVDTAWRKLGETRSADRERWLAALHSTWKDVARGDNMTIVVVPGKLTRFYDQAELIGEITDPAFGPAFLSIWLHPRSVLTDLRVQLLGLDQPRLSAND